MQVLSTFLSQIGFGSPRQGPQRQRLQSSSLDSKSAQLMNAEREAEESSSCKSALCSLSLRDPEFLQMASMALNLEAGSSLFCDSCPEMRRFQSESSEAVFSMDLLTQKTDEQVRNEYINRLKYLKVIKDTHTKHHQSITVFDWDDTILPTSYLYYVGLEKINPEIEAKLQTLDRNVSKLLIKASRIGKTFIVTNGMDKWVEKSSKMYLPYTYQAIQQNNIVVISARARYEAKYPASPNKWKEETFVDIGRCLDEQIMTNIICLGDKDYEIDAAINLSKQFKQAIVKTVKFKECPTALELTKQIGVVLDKFDQIYTTLKTLSITLEKKHV